MPRKHLASNQLKRKQLSDQEEDSPSKHPKLSSPTSSSSNSSTPLNTRTSTNTTNTTMNDSNAGNVGTGSGSSGDGNAILFQKMNHINSELISLDHLFSLRGSKYFIDHKQMLDEFIENIHHFLGKVDGHRQRHVGAFEGKGEEDILSHILQYVTMWDLVRNCQKVSTTWRKQVLKQKFKVELGNLISNRDPKAREYYSMPHKQSNIYSLTVESLLKSEFIGRVVSLKLKNVSDELLELLVRNSKSLSKLQHLDLKGYELGFDVKKVKLLKQLGSSCENLTSLNLVRVQELDGEEALDILSSQL